MPRPPSQPPPEHLDVDPAVPTAVPPAVAHGTDLLVSGVAAPRVVTGRAMLGRLAAAIRSGDLATVLVLARHRQDLSLRDVVGHVSDHGLASSTTTLSNWERGEQQPRRRASLLVLDELDRLYELPRGTLRSVADGRSAGANGIVASVPSPFAGALAELGGQSPYRTWSLHEFHTIGADRRPVAHRTRQLLEAVEEPLERYLYGFDTRGMGAEPEVTAVAGCRVGRRLRDGARHVVELAFDDTVEVGRTHLFEYATSLDYDAPAPPELRRVVRTPMRQMIIRVDFTGEVPAAVQRVVWDDYDGEPQVREQLSVGSDGSVHTVIDTPRPDALHGLRWRWGR